MKIDLSLFDLRAALCDAAPAVRLMPGQPPNRSKYKQYGWLADYLPLEVSLSHSHKGPGCTGLCCAVLQYLWRQASLCHQRAQFVRPLVLAVRLLWRLSFDRQIVLFVGQVIF